MARYGPEHKEATRRRMIETAGRRFKSDGIDGSGIATLVADAGLTNGAFYGHFRSKDDLVASVVARQLEDQVARVNALPAGVESVVAFLDEYLSPTHRDDAAGGCPSAALLDEIGRCDEATKQAYTDGARSMISAIARHLDDGDAADRERTRDRSVHAARRLAPARSRGQRPRAVCSGADRRTRQRHGHRGSRLDRTLVDHGPQPSLRLGDGSRVVGPLAT